MDISPPERQKSLPCGSSSDNPWKDVISSDESDIGSGDEYCPSEESTFSDDEKPKKKKKESFHHEESLMTRVLQTEDLFVQENSDDEMLQAKSYEIDHSRTKHVGYRTRNKTIKSPPYKTSRKSESDVSEPQEEEGITVPSCNNTSSKRVYDKLMYCFYNCQRTYTDIRKHYLVKHKNENEVKEIMATEEHSEKRKLLLEKLRNLGNFSENLRIIKRGNGQLVVRRRPKKGKTVPWQHYLPCKFCFGFYYKYDLKLHCRKCICNTNNSSQDIVKSSILLAYQARAVSKTKLFFELVVSKMKQDDICKAVIFDDLILQFGSFLIGKNENKIPIIILQVRQLAKLLIELKNRSKDKGKKMCLEDFLKAKHFEFMMEVVQEMTFFSPLVKMDNCKRKSLAIKLGHSINKCAAILIGKSIRINDWELRTEVQEFLALVEAEWEMRIRTMTLREDQDVLHYRENEESGLLDNSLQEKDEICSQMFENNIDPQMLENSISKVDRICSEMIENAIDSKDDGMCSQMIENAMDTDKDEICSKMPQVQTKAETLQKEINQLQM